MISIQQRIFNHLIGLIEEGNLRPHEKMPAESDLCKLFKASRNTVRKAYDELVHKEYVVRKPGLGSFVKDREAENKSYSVGIIVPGMDVFDETMDPIAGHLKFDIFNGILERAHEANARISMIPAGENWRVVPDIDGYLLLYYDDNILKRLRDAGAPCVGSHLGNAISSFPNVTIDFHNSFSKCFEYLVKMGHRKIGLVDNIFFSVLPAYREVMNRHGLPAEDSQVESFDKGTPENGVETFLKLIEKQKKLDAIFFRSDLTAIAALKYCENNGIKVPEEFSIMSFDNIPEAAYTRPGLTTFDTARRLRGYIALRKLKQIIKDPSSSQMTEYVEGKIIERGSVKKREV